MADSTTTHWGLTKPEPGSSRDTWGAKLNVDWDAVDAIMAALCPIGSVTDFASTFAPYGWLICDGTIYPIASYPKLAAILGSSYGGDGVTTFAVPDCRGRVIAGAGGTTDSGGTVGGYTVGQMYGFFLAPISAANLPPVAVTIDAVGDHAHTGYTDVQGLHAHNGSTDAQGDHAHTYHRSSVSTPATQLAPGSGFALNETDPTTGTAGNHAHNISTTVGGNHQHNVQTYNAGAHTHTGRIAGGGAPLDVRNPMIAFNKIIFAGPPGFTTLSSPIPGAPARLSSPMRGGG